MCDTLSSVGLPHAKHFAFAISVKVVMIVDQLSSIWVVATDNLSTMAMFVNIFFLEKLTGVSVCERQHNFLR